MKKLLQIILGICLIIGLTTVAMAQGQSANATINANANVIAQLNVASGNNLAFGNVSPGINKSIAYGDPSAGTFTVSGGSSASINLSFSLPANLTDASSNTLGISFSSTDANWEDGTTSSGTNVFDPNSGTTTAIPSDGDMTVFIGGTVNPVAGQTAGSYTGQITLTATYN